MTSDTTEISPLYLNPKTANTRISIVIPVFKHSALVRETMYSIVRQPNFSDVDVIFIDDGCPDPQTYTTLISFCSQWTNVHYIKQANAGLSAARNSGIRFIIEELPDAEGIFFLDADNSLAPYGISAMQTALNDRPETDWFYPDIRMFGFRSFNDYSGDYNSYIQAVVNVCEAGSLIRRRMIETDLRFDETMRLGYEDWDFWLSAIERGFRGSHLPALGLSYRKRAESMLVNSQRVDEQIRDYMRRKHDRLFQTNNFVRMEHDELPRFAVVLSDVAVTELGTDLQIDGFKLSNVAYEKQLWQAIREPAFVSAGQFLLSTTQRIFDLLRRIGLIRWISIEIEQALDDHNFVSVDIVSSRDDVIRVRRHHNFTGRSHLFASSRRLIEEIALDESESWILGLLKLERSYKVFCIEISLPQQYTASQFLKNLAANDFVQFCLHLRCNDLSGRARNVVRDVFLGSRPLNDMMLRARGQFDGVRLPPIADPRQGRIAFVLPHCDFGGVEKVTFCLSRELRRLGVRTSLILIGDSAVYRASDAQSAFDDISILDSKDRIAGWSGPSFFGTRAPKILDDKWARELLNFLSSFELVVSCHSAEILSLFGGLRRRDVITATYLHLFDKTEVGAYCGHPTLALAYEHAIDLVLTCSDSLAFDMAALGLPRMKILPLPNAPSLTWRDSMEPPSRSQNDRPLNVLYIGRLDNQKGLDRLAAIFDEIHQDRRYDIRIIGKAVLTPGDLVLSRYSQLIEPPIYDEEGLSKAYSWADVLLLPSRYEGLPLTVLEAMAHGVVPIVTECGALTEALETGVSGYIVPQDQCVDGFLMHLEALAADRKRLADISRAASARATSRPWSMLAERLRDRLESLRIDRAKAKAAKAAMATSMT
ncbi:glycosyltransferase [Methylorubrum populi]|uniref:Glycosyltransferase 2-like domain-containing protein n=1 Tax=Methylorubrum populi TaxID=223967 RepID=A0A833J3F8_9HYPH|nr:glycosyltransferase [Methylorubrum populi]KAB7783820.1 hypothetical protein F8B43_3743 [Methylorubrum populi]